MRQASRTVRRSGRKGHRAVGLLILIVLLLTLLISRSGAVPVLDSLRDLLVNTVTGLITRNLKGTVQVGALRGSLFSAPVLHDVKLLGPEGEVVAQIDEIRVSYDLKSLLKKRLDVHQVDIIRPWVTLVEEADGRLNLIDLLSSGQPDSSVEHDQEPSPGLRLPFAIVLKRVQIRGGELVMQLQQLSVARAVERLSAPLRLTAEVNVAASVPQVAPASPQGTLEAHLLEVSGDAALPPSSVRLEGTYASQQGGFTLAVTEGPYHDTRLAGHVVVHQGLHVTLETLRLQHQDLVWQNVQPIEVHRRPQGQIEIQDVLLRSGSQVIRAHASLAPEGALQADLHVQQVQIQPTVHVFAPEAVVPSGHLSLDLTVRGSLEQPEVQGQLQLAALQWRELALGEIRGASWSRRFPEAAPKRCVPGSSP